MKTLKERFEMRFIPEPNTGCWLWTAGFDKNGYGLFSLNKTKMCYAHRFSFELYKNKLLGSLQCLHKCDTPACVNPEHLFSGSADDNMKDKVKKNRQCKGEKHLAKLSDLQVLDIRSRLSYRGSQKDMAKEFNTSANAIHDIIRRKKWRHI